MLGSVEARELAFEFQSLGSVSAPPDAALQNFIQRSSFTVIKLRPGWKRLAPRFLATEQR
jgi:hypothetical protein